MTTVPGVFAAGDVVHGSKTVVDAVREAKTGCRELWTIWKTVLQSLTQNSRDLSREMNA